MELKDRDTNGGVRKKKRTQNQKGNEKEGWGHDTRSENRKRL